MRSSGRTAAAVANAQAQTAFPVTAEWTPWGLATGDTGLALVCGYVDACFPGDGWDIEAHHRLTAGASALPWHAPHSLSASLFEGLGGLAFAVRRLSRGGSRYQSLSRAVDALFLPRAAEVVRSLDAQSRRRDVSRFDVISGGAGVGAVLLRQESREDGDDGDRQQVLSALLRAFVRMMDDTEGLSLWFTPAHLIGDEALVRLYPYGVLNCGLAHGLPGPLALMALALENGAREPGLAEATERLADRLVGLRVPSEGGWPSMIPLTPEGRLGPREPSRTAWCYGTPGAARALWLAGRALHRTDLCATAAGAMRTALERPVAQRGVDAPTFCHGVAGLLQTTLRLAYDTHETFFVRQVGELTEQVLALYDPDSLLGYRDREPGDRLVDRAGLLTGAPGVAAVLLAVGTGAVPFWDRAFLIA
ncbi:lanthionine synthetase C family protein [Streptomyces pseudogriseolus]|uniref:lanthionine synthetase C family protein n=1 Tax=Streptomyces pseudogriseolus TaxID=36817 RepID=UPI003FA311CB